MIEFYSEGFFGYGEVGDFKYFSLAHIVPLVLLGLAIYLTYKYRKNIRDWKYEERFRYIMSFVMIIVEMSYYFRTLYVGSEIYTEARNLLYKLPLQLCQWALICCSYMILSKNKLLFNFNFFVSICFGSAAMITPSVISATGPTYYRYYQFWLEHGLPVYMTIYMIFVHKMTPDIKKLPIVAGTVFLYGLLCIYVNNKLGTDFLYLVDMEADKGGFNPILAIPGGQFVRLILLILLGHIICFLHYLGWKKFLEKHEL